MKPEAREFFSLPNEDAICQAIFAGTIALGRPDAVIARELTDGVMHFILADADHGPQDDVNELVVKLVRELGHPQLAQVLDIASITTPWTGYSTEQLQLPETMSRERVFPPNLIAAHDAGLLRLFHLDLPCHLVGGVMPRPQASLRPQEWHERISDARKLFGRHVIIDDPEHLLGGADATEWLNAIVAALNAEDLHGILAFNSSSADSEVRKSLFSPRQPSLWGEEATHPARELLQVSLKKQFAKSPISRRWHLSASDFRPECRDSMMWLEEFIQHHPLITIVFDRPRSNNNAVTANVLQHVEVSLVALRGYLAGSADVGTFLSKVGSLTRLALSAGHAKRAFLRNAGSAELRSAFLADRSSLYLFVSGLQIVTEHFFARDCSDRTEFVSKIRQQVIDAVAADSPIQATQVAFDNDETTIEISLATPNESLAELVATINCTNVCVEITPDVSLNGKLASLLELLWLATPVERVYFAHN